MSNMQTRITNTLLGVGIAGAMLLTGCDLPIGDSDSSEYPTTRIPPMGDFVQPTTGFKGLSTCDATTPIVLYNADMACPAWQIGGFFGQPTCSNRIELTLQGTYPQALNDPRIPFSMQRGVDYDICSVDTLVLGVPDTAETIIVGSNHLGLSTAADFQTSPAAQAALEEFVRSGGNLALHMAGNVPEGFGYIAPGLGGPVVENNDSNIMLLVATDGNFVAGFDGEIGTPDDASQARISWLPSTDSAHQGTLRGILPDNANVVLTDGNGDPIYAMYNYGRGRVIGTSATVEFGEEFFWNGRVTGYGHTNLMVTNHLFNAINRPPEDKDRDGVDAKYDCDDNDPYALELVFEDTFYRNTEFFNETQQLSGDPWSFHNGKVTATGASQQALMGQAQTWDDVVIKATVASKGTYGGCCVNGPTHRWRTGVVVRANADADQDEGFNGYRCALGSNAQPLDGILHGGDSTGEFLQLAKFLDAAEDNISSECEGGVNSTFDQLARTDYDTFSFNRGGKVELSFWAVGSSLHCQVKNGDEVYSAHAYDAEFTNGTVGLSTLNMFGQFDEIKVCRTNVTP